TPTTERFSVAGKEYDVNDMQAIESELKEIGVITPKHPSINVTFTIRGPTGREELLKYLQQNPEILINALSRSQALHEGNLSQNITIVLADRYDYLAGDHRDNNLIILNASDLEAMIQKENPTFVTELITSILSEELAHERGAQGDVATEQLLARECANNTMTSLGVEGFEAYIGFIERYGTGLKEGYGYLGYLAIIKTTKINGSGAFLVPALNERDLATYRTRDTSVEPKRDFTAETTQIVDITVPSTSLIDVALFNGEAVLEDRDGFLEVYSDLVDIDPSIVAVIIATTEAEAQALRALGLPLGDKMKVELLQGEALSQYEDLLSPEIGFNVIMGNKIPEDLNALRQTLSGV
ncbi:hypothetical protein ACFL0P_06100, partial [Candidatus Omnitrophota bacterium]